MLERHLYLIGMPGSGKSSLGRKVANNLRLPFLDLDRRIQEILNGTVTEIFERYGEDAFRTAETNMLIQLMGTTPSIISTGGGIAMNPLNRELMKASGAIILVDRPLEQILSDIKLDRRPLLAEKGLPEVERLYNERIDTYRTTADLTIVNGGDYFSGVDVLQKLITDHFAV